MPTSSKSSTRKPPTKASQATTFAIEATLRDRATKPKKFKLGDWAQVSGMVRACWPDEGKGDAGAAGRPTIHRQRGLDRETVETPGLLDRQAERMGV